MQGIKKPNLKGLGIEYLHWPLLPRKAHPVKNQAGSWLAASAYSLRLPKSIASVAIADFVPLTVAGQRWSCTIFPDHSMMLRYNLVFDPY